MVTVENVLNIVPALSVAIALVYYGLQIRNQNKTRQAQIYMQIYNKFSDPDFLEIYYETIDREWTNFQDWYEKYGTLRHTNRRQFSRNVSMGSWFEGIGVLVKRGFLDPLLIDDLLSQFIIDFWNKMRSVILEYRVQLKWPQAYEHVEYLYNVIKPIVEEQHPEL